MTTSCEKQNLAYSCPPTRVGRVCKALQCLILEGTDPSAPKDNHNVIFTGDYLCFHHSLLSSWRAYSLVLRLRIIFYLFP